MSNMEITTTEATDITTLNNTILTTPDTIHGQEYYNLQSGKEFIAKYYIWIIFAFGFPGNLLSFFVVMRMSRRRLTTSLFYVALLAVVDSIAIILKIIENQIRNNEVPMAAESCKCLFFLGLTLAAYPNWILIIMSAERFTAVRFPMKVGLIWSLKKAVVIIVGVLVFLCLVNLHIFFTVTATPQYRCTIWPQYRSFYFPGWFFISSSVYAFIPAVTLTVFNILIILVLRRSSIQRRSLLSDPAQSNDDSRRQERQVTVMLVTVAIVFITLTIPRCIFTIIWSYWMPTDATGKMRKQFLDVLTSNIADSNHAVNFYLYFVSGRKFRKYFLEMFHCEPKRYHEVSNGTTQMSVLPVAESGM